MESAVVMAAAAGVQRDVGATLGQSRHVVRLGLKDENKGEKVPLVWVVK